MSRQDFERTFAKGRRFSSTHLSIIVTPSTQTGRCAVSVGKKIAKRAVARNKIRRQIYRALGNMRSLWNTSHVVVLPRPSCTHISPEEFAKELEDTLIKATRT